MKTLLTAGALLVASSTAFAGTYTSEAEFGTQGTLTDQAINFGINQDVTVAGFDASLGSLTGVAITVYSQIDTAASSINSSGLDGASQYKLTLTQDWTVASSVGDFTFNGSENLITELDSNHEAGELFTVDQTALFRTGSISVTDLSLFASDVDFTFNIVADSIFQNVSAGTGLFTNQIDSAAWGKVEVAYTYIEGTPVPETGSLAIFGLGLAGFALSRKAKKSA